MSLEYGSSHVSDYYRHAFVDFPLQAQKLLDFTSCNIIPSTFVNKTVLANEGMHHSGSLSLDSSSSTELRVPTSLNTETESIPLWMAVLKFAGIDIKNEYIDTTLKTNDGSVCLLSLDIINRCPETVNLEFIANGKSN